MKLSEMTIEQLQQLIADAQNEITAKDAAGKGFYKKFSVSSQKAYSPATYKQIQYAELLETKTGSEIAASHSQLLKYFNSEDMSEAIELMKEGKRIRIA